MGIKAAIRRALKAGRGLTTTFRLFSVNFEYLESRHSHDMNSSNVTMSIIVIASVVRQSTEVAIFKTQSDEPLPMSAAIAESYMQSWLNQDEGRFLSLLAPDVLVVESYGPVYRGHSECAAWFEGWHGAPTFGRVTKWELGRCFFDAERSATFCEWDFACFYEGKSGGFLGSSLYLLRDGLIAELHEYKTEREQYRPYKMQL